MKASLRAAATPSPQHRSRPRVNDWLYPKTRPSGQHTRRQFSRLAVGAAALPAVSRSADAQSYPSRRVRLIVPVAAGGPTDAIARLIGRWLSDHLGQQFIIENRPGGSNNIGTEAVVRAAPDGYTLLLANSVNTINTSLFEKLNYDFIRDIEPVASIASAPSVMAVNPSVPVTTVPAFIAYLKANPAKINMGSAGIGTPGHIFGELFKMMTGVNMVHVPYRGAAPMLTDLLGGQVQVAFADLFPSVEYIKSGKLRPLAITTATRWAGLPNVPPVGDFLPGFEASGWYGIGVPKNTPAEIVEKLNLATNSALADSMIKGSLSDLGFTVLAGSPADLRGLIAEDTAKWAKVVKFSGAKAE
jgi:tripartite-type tricarboxylate transporter receptor subunit TctC